MPSHVLHALLGLRQLLNRLLKLLIPRFPRLLLKLLTTQLRRFKLLIPLLSLLLNVLLNLTLLDNPLDNLALRKSLLLLNLLLLNPHLLRRIKRISTINPHPSKLGLHLVAPPLPLVYLRQPLPDNLPLALHLHLLALRPDAVELPVVGAIARADKEVVGVVLLQ